MKAFLFSVLISALPLSAQAALQIGKIIKTAGVDFTINDKKVGVEAPLFWGDRILTGKGTTVEVLVYPSFSIKLQPSSALKVIGSIIEKQASGLSTTSALKVLKGKIQGQVIKKTDEILKTRIYGNRTISSIRGTVFEIDTTSPAEAAVFEGEVEVEVPLLEQKVSVTSDQVLNIQGKQPTLEPLKEEKPQLASREEIESIWSKDGAAITAAHAKEAQKYKKILNQDISSMNKSLQKDAAGMFKNLRGVYDNKKKSK